MDIWTEKYRPKTFDEFTGQTEIVNRIKNFVENKSIPHMMFAGPAGIGKTTLAVLVAKSLYGDQWKNNFLELNASDERGIDVIRHKVKDFARTMALQSEYKIILLDESDALTAEAQQALRRTMESYAKTCRFILACNYSSRIIEPIQSRCAVFRFRPLNEQEMRILIDKIAANEGLIISPESYDALMKVGEGDVRRTINVLQSAGASSKTITDKLIFDVAAKARPEEVTRMLNSAISGRFLEAREQLYKALITEGLSGEEVIKEIHRQVYSLDITERQKVEVIEKIGEYEFRIAEGGNEQIQLEALLARISALGK